MLTLIILYGLLASLLFILTSWRIAKSGKVQNTTLRVLVMITGIIFLGGMVLVIPFIPQPRLDNLYLQLCLGIPLAIVGMILRIYPMIYLKRRGTRTDLGTPSTLITSGPYAWVRHPQYAAGVVFIMGWFLIWGGIYSIYLLPLLVMAIIFQAHFEEKYILEPEFKEEYLNYKKTVGMIFPRIWNLRRK
ncbi:MAG: methyltransferase family protein [Methanomicrobiales archaeon]